MRHILALILAIPLMATAAVAQSLSGCGTFSSDSFQGGREDLWKQGRWAVTHYDSGGEGYVDVYIQYQKNRDLVCWTPPIGLENCYGADPERWHTTVRYTGLRLGAPDSAGMSAFARDYISGRYNETTDSLSALSVNSPGRVVYTKPEGGVTLTAGGC